MDSLDLESHNFIFIIKFGFPQSTSCRYKHASWDLHVSSSCCAQWTIQFRFHQYSVCRIEKTCFRIRCMLLVSAWNRTATIKIKASLGIVLARPREGEPLTRHSQAKTSIVVLQWTCTRRQEQFDDSLWHPAADRWTDSELMHPRMWPRNILRGSLPPFRTSSFKFEVTGSYGGWGAWSDSGLGSRVAWKSS